MLHKGPRYAQGDTSPSLSGGGAANTTASQERPTIENPLKVYSPAKGSREVFDPSPLINLLGEASKYESAVLITYRGIILPTQVQTSWGEATAYPKHDVIAQPWVVNAEGRVENAGKEYPLKRTELAKRVAADVTLEDGTRLLKKPGVTSFFKIPDDLVGAIHVFSPETPLEGQAQIVKKGDIIAFTETGPWVMAWDDKKFREVK